jgi:hypothetical protein
MRDVSGLELLELLEDSPLVSAPGQDKVSTAVWRAAIQGSKLMRQHVVDLFNACLRTSDVPPSNGGLNHIWWTLKFQCLAKHVQTCPMLIATAALTSDRSYHTRRFSMSCKARPNMLNAFHNPPDMMPITHATQRLECPGGSPHASRTPWHAPVTSPQRGRLMGGILKFSIR